MHCDNQKKKKELNDTDIQENEAVQGTDFLVRIGDAAVAAVAAASVAVVGLMHEDGGDGGFVKVAGGVARE